MCALRCGRCSAASLKPGVLGMLLLLALASGGCSSTGHMHGQTWSRSTEPPARIAAEASAKTELEEDGLEAQIPPPPTIRLAPDDPSEPFSPNYGHPVGTPTVAPATPPPPPKPRPVARPPRSKFAAMDID